MPVPASQAGSQLTHLSVFVSVKVECPGRPDESDQTDKLDLALHASRGSVGGAGPGIPLPPSL